MPPKPVVWVYRDGSDVWCVRCEGEPTEHRMPSRERAICLARTMVAAAGGYRLFLQLRNGRFVTECLNFCEARRDPTAIPAS